MTTHQEALEAFCATLQLPTWYTDAELLAAIRAYISTLTADTAGLVERLRAEVEEQHRMGEPIDGEKVLAAADTITALTARITALEALVDRAGEALEPFAGFAESIAANHPGWDHDGFAMSTTPTGMMLPFSWFRRSRSTLTAIKEARHGN